jgi:septum formation protein
MNLALASQSPRRLALLAQIGITPTRVVAPSIDETPLKAELPHLLAERLARAKAAAVAIHEGEVVLAADTVVAVGRRILPQANTPEEVEACLRLLSGRAHRVYTAVCVQNTEHARLRVVETRVKVKRLSDPEIAAYVALGEGLGKAGGYAIQGYAAGFIVRLVGSYTNVVGLPLYETRNLLMASAVIPPTCYAL